MTTDTIEPELLHLEEAARVLRIGRSRAYEMAARGELPGLIRIGRSLRVSRRSLIRWIDEQTDGSATPARVTLPEGDRNADGPTHLRPF
jgi:excisionase family DNA binding protein